MRLLRILGILPLAGCVFLTDLDGLSGPNVAPTDEGGLPGDGGSDAPIVVPPGTTTPPLDPDGGTGTGRDGPLDVTTDVIINPSASITIDVAAGATTITVDDASAFKADAAVLVWRTTGVASAASGDTTPLDVATTPVGRFEIGHIAIVSGNTITLKTPLAGAFAASVSQVVRVPEHTDVTIHPSGKIHAPPWDGKTGGIVAMLLTGALVNDGKIVANAAGFRGGVGWLTPTTVTASGGGACDALDGDPAEGCALKGEGVWPDGFTNINDGTGVGGRGNVANGGGGGNCSNAGGGGGGHGGAGGGGGNTWSNTGNADVGGIGGGAMQYDPFARLVMGGGGGAGDDDAPFSGKTSNGGAGGGVVFIRARSVSGTGLIGASGEDGLAVASNGGAGGGAGGLVAIDVIDSVSCTQAINARGGAGSSVSGGWGPGGGGGGGRIIVRAKTAACALDATEGKLGAPPHGGTDGKPGTTATVLP